MIPTKIELETLFKTMRDGRESLFEYEGQTMSFYKISDEYEVITHCGVSLLINPDDEIEIKAYNIESIDENTLHAYRHINELEHLQIDLDKIEFKR